MKATTHTATVKLYLELEVDVTGHYIPEKPATFYRSNGDPGDPPEYAEYSIHKVECKGIDITNILSDDDWSSLEESCLEYIEGIDESPDEKDFD